MCGKGIPCGDLRSGPRGSARQKGCGSHDESADRSGHRQGASLLLKVFRRARVGMVQARTARARGIVLRRDCRRSRVSHLSVTQEAPAGPLALSGMRYGCQRNDSTDHQRSEQTAARSPHQGMQQASAGGHRAQFAIRLPGSCLTQEPASRPHAEDDRHCQTAAVNPVAIVVIVNAVAFTVYLHRQRYERLWLAALGALLIGPLIWLWWAVLRWRDSRQPVE